MTDQQKDKTSRWQQVLVAVFVAILVFFLCVSIGGRVKSSLTALLSKKPDVRPSDSVDAKPLGPGEHPKAPKLGDLPAPPKDFASAYKQVTDTLSKDFESVPLIELNAGWQPGRYGDEVVRLQFLIETHGFSRRVVERLQDTRADIAPFAKNVDDASGLIRDLKNRYFAQGRTRWGTENRHPEAEITTYAESYEQWLWLLMLTRDSAESFFPDQSPVGLAQEISDAISKEPLDKLARARRQIDGSVSMCALYVLTRIYSSTDSKQIMETSGRNYPILYDPQGFGWNLLETIVADCEKNHLPGFLEDPKEGSVQLWGNYANPALYGSVAIHPSLSPLTIFYQLAKYVQASRSGKVDWDTRRRRLELATRVIGQFYKKGTDRDELSAHYNAYVRVYMVRACYMTAMLWTNELVRQTDALEKAKILEYIDTVVTSADDFHGPLREESMAIHKYNAAPWNIATYETMVDSEAPNYRSRLYDRLNSTLDHSNRHPGAPVPTK